MANEAATDIPARNGEDEVRVSTLELFFDLVFVFTLTQLTVKLAGDLTVSAFGQVVALFVVLFWMYAAYVYLTNQVPPDRTSRRLLLMGGMAAFLVCALAIPGAFDGDGVVFGIGYLLVVLLHGSLYTQSHGRMVLTYAPTNVLGALLVLIAGTTSGTTAVALWAGAIGLQFVNTFGLRWFSARRAAAGTSGGDVVVRLGGVDVGHFTERHGLLLIVAFGESVIAVGVGLEHPNLNLLFFTGLLLGLALVASLWWTFFVRDSEAADEALRAVPLTDRWRTTLFAYYYSFIPMLLGVVVLAAGVKKSLGHLDEQLAAGPALALGGGVALYLAGDFCFRWSLGLTPRVYRAAGAALALATVPLGTASTAVAQLAALVLVVVAMLGTELRACRAPAGNPA
ncbi:low temperature requirement protein A [Streptomyces sp. NPDC051940]|uniref:low temperature requirement protein A n=1 Tax=Streptomyces sp. NPDC051940 TaxID=3155675 RepID=UPI003424AFB0